MRHRDFLPAPMPTPRRPWLLPLLAATVAALIAGPAGAAEPAGAPRDADGRYRNFVPIPARSFTDLIALNLKVAFDKPAGTVPDQPVPVQPVAAADIAAAPDASLWKFGHSTVLIKLAGALWLTDPVFGERASPLSFIGPKRFHAPPIALDALPDIRAVLISHDHYDHLDRGSIEQLAAKTDWFVTPLGVGDRLIEWGVPAAKVRQLDWWQSTTIDGVRLVATPARHFSGRSLTDRNSTLWASWAILGAGQRIFYSGDTGWHAEFKTIGERLGPFDVTLIECGAYNTLWPDVHLMPEQAVQAHRDLRGRRLVPVHHGTFDLAMHRWDEPMQRVAAAAAAAGIDMVLPGVGMRLHLPLPLAVAAMAE
jgi:L-ascorbate metabolism protein UlaG (beta-lactamase superfamily)